jgi:hypothetical protein
MSRDGYVFIPGTSGKAHYTTIEQILVNGSMLKGTPLDIYASIESTRKAFITRLALFNWIILQSITPFITYAFLITLD